MNARTGPVERPVSSRIDRFKLAPIPEVTTNRPGRPLGVGAFAKPLHTVKDSLVGASLRKHGHNPTTFTYANGRTCEHPDGEFHNCAYVSARNRLIYTAEQNVKRALIAAKQDPNGGKFDAPFMAEMTRLWVERR